MDQTYWIIEYMKLLLAYIFVLFVWPSVVFRPHLKGKGAAYRFTFCTTMTVLLVTTVVLLLGLAHILTPLSSGALFFGVFAVQLCRNFDWDMSWIYNLRRTSKGTMSRKQLVLRVFSWFGKKIRQGLSYLWAWSRGRRLELSLLLLVVLFGTLYFSYGAFDTHAYGSGDQYVHHEWIYQLKLGNAFSDGIYPEGMHCMLYLLCSSFGIRLYTGVLFFGGVHILVLLLSFYLFMSEVFHWRYSGILALCMFMTLRLTNLDAIFGMARLSWTLPLEYAMHAQFFSALALLRFYRKVSEGYRLRLSVKHPLRSVGMVFKDPDLLIFTLSIAVTIAVHFYVTINAFFICLSVAVVSIRQVFKRGSFGPVVVSVFLSLVLAVAPMGIAYASGVPFQGSIDWAIGIITGKDRNDEGQDSETEGEKGSEISVEESAEQRDGSVGTVSGNMTVSHGGSESLASPSNAENAHEPDERASPATSSLIETVSGLLRVLYDSGLALFPTHRLSIMVALAFVFLTYVVLLLIRLLLRKKNSKQEEERERKPVRWKLDGILTAAIALLFFVLLCSAGDLGLPMLMEPVRISSTMNLLMMMLYTFPLDLLLYLLSRVAKAIVLKAVFAALAFGIYIFAHISGEFHGYLFYHFTRYDAAVTVTNDIIKKIPEKMFTIVSTTEELYQIIEYGYHEELLTFVNRSADATYTLPTPYVFVFIEKHPLHYAHYHFMSGPKWLASESYADLFGSIASQCPVVLAGDLSVEEASKGIKYGQKLSDAATDLEGRIILESKMYYNWYKNFSKIYPNESRVVYEDDDFLCYCLVQNPASLYTLGGKEFAS